MIKKYLSCLAAIVLAAICYAAAKLPSLSSADSASLAARFSFKKLPLPEVEGVPPHKTVRQVHPHLERISAWVSSLGAAATLTDLDADGLANDLIYVDPRTDLVTVCPAPGTPIRYKPFALNTPFWGTKSYDPATIAPMGTVAGDFNEDGLMDLLVYFWGRTPVIYLRKIKGSNGLSIAKFAPQELVESGERWYSNCATQADIDGDGHIDLVFGNYFQDDAKILHSRDTESTVVMHEGKSQAANGGKDRVLLWQGAEGSPDKPAVAFKEITHALPELVARQWALAVGAADLDGDLLPELYIANDFGPDRLLHNRSSPGRVELVVIEGERDFFTPKSCVVGHDSFKGMGVDFADLNGDGFFDIYVSNIATKFGLTESHFLWLSTGDIGKMKSGVAPYVHGSEKMGLARSGFSFEARLADFNNDGVLEAMQACGFIKGNINRWPELQALGTSNDQIVHNPRFWPSFRPGADLSGNDWNPFFVRGADGRYHDIAQKLGLSEPMVSRGIATADVDGDGRLDFVCANQWQPSCFLKNESEAGSFLGLRLVLEKGSPAIGAVASVKLPDGRTLISQIDGGNGHSGRRSPEIHFGLGSADKSKPLPVQIKWRSRAGKPEQKGFHLNPGWHTINLAREERPQTALAPASTSRPIIAGTILR